MRTDKYMMAKAWMKQDQAPQSEALETWNTLEAEFNEERKAMLMASAESDKLKEELNKDLGPGTIKYGSEIPQPSQRPDVIEIDAINAFMKRNPAAEGGRMEFGRGKKVLDKTEKKNVLNWGKNKSKALGETWSDKKTLKEYNNSSRFSRSKIRLGIITGEGIPGFKKKGDFKPLTKEQQKVWDATMADKVGKWEDYGVFNRGNWLKDFDKKLDQYNQTKNLLNRKELGDFLKEKLGKDYGAFDKKKISGVRSGAEKTKFGQYVDDKLFVNEFSGGQQKYYKKPTDAQIKFMKENLFDDVTTNSLNKSTLDTVKKIDRLYGSIYKSGNLPDLKVMIKKLDLTGNQIGYAESLLARIYGGHKFRNGPDIRINKKTSNSMFELISKSGFGNPRRNQIYNMSLDLIDEGLGNEKNTFYNLKNKAKNILKENGIKVHSKKSPIGFNIDEFAGVTGSGKSKSMAVSQFINIMEGNLNTKTLASFQGGLSKARAAVEAAKGTPRYNSVLKKQMELINTRAANLEAEYGIKLARLERPADINNMSKDEVKRLKNIKLGTDENLYQRLVKDAKASGYSIKVPEGSLTIQEFTDPNNARARELIALVGCPNFKGKQAFAEGGRTGFSEGGDCFDKGQKLINNGMKDASPASMRNFGKFANSALKLGRNVMKFGVIPEAMFIGAESLVRMGMGDTLSEASKQAVGFYLDPIFGTNFAKEGAFSKMERDVGSEMAFDVAKLNEYKEALAKKESIESNKKNALAVNDESLTGLTDQEVAAQYDANIAKAQAELNKRMLTETERVDFENKADTAEDVAGVKSPIRQAIGKARSDTEMMRYEDDFTGMQSDMFTQDPMSAKAKKDSLSNLLPQKGMTPRLSNFVNFDDRQLEQLSGLTKKPVEELRDYQDYLNKERAMSLLQQEQIYGKEQTYGTQGNFFGEQINKKPMYDYAEGGITGLRSKYEYKK